MSGRGFLLNVAALVVALVAVAGLWLGLGFLGLAIEEPVRFAVDQAGPIAAGILLLALLIAWPLLAMKTSRDMFRRQYALDRTVHIEKPASADTSWTLWGLKWFWIVPAWVVVAVFFGMAVASHF